MSHIKVESHGVVKIEIEEMNTVISQELDLVTVWRRIVITDANGDKLTISCFALQGDGEKLPVSFVRDLDKESS